MQCWQTGSVQIGSKENEECYDYMNEGEGRNRHNLKTRGQEIKDKHTRTLGEQRTEGQL